MNLNTYLDSIQENLKNQGALDIKNNVETKNGNFNTDLVVKLTNFELNFGLFDMRGDTFLMITYFHSINLQTLRPYSAECLEYGKEKVTSSITAQLFNFRIPSNICFSVAVVDNLDQENKTKIRQENPFNHNVDLLWYEVPVVYCLSEEQLYFYDQPSSIWEKFKGEVAWKKLRTVIETALIP
ncbi:MAG: hypothetical protein F6K24_32200 [Okeania sp. SIO2D1]|nr:hypothetical protein [Okeania sp. SIO2D1]